MHEGKQPDIEARFKNVTFGLFEKHGIRVCDFYTDATGAERCYYILAFEDESDMDAKWTAFKNDPEWIEKKEASHKNGVIVKKIDSYVMTRAPYVTPAWPVSE